MTVVRRRAPAVPVRTGRGKPAPLNVRFRKGRRVQVHEDVQDARFAGRLGTVVSVVDEPDEEYPRGRVAVRLAVDELYASLFGRPAGSKQPNPVWFKPGDLDRNPEPLTPTGDF